MSNPHTMNVPTGRKLDQGPSRPEGWVGEFNPLAPATEEGLKLARRHFTEARAEDFERVGRDWIDRTGTAYRIDGSNPLLASDPKTTSAAVFIVQEGSLLFLRPKDAESATTTVVLGDMHAGLVDPGDIRTSPGKAPAIW